MTQPIPFFAISLIAVSLVSSCSSTSEKPTSRESGGRSTASRFQSGEDPHLWLEEIEGEKQLEWVKERSAKSLAELKGDPRYTKLFDEMKHVVLAKDKLAYPAYSGGMIYNFWQDEKHVRGIWRRTSIAGYSSGNPKWETVLDLDRIAKAENENWVWKGAGCKPPEGTRCLLYLSRGGKDATVVREYDVKAKAFVSGGFEAPEAHTQADWLNEDTLLIGTNWGPGTTTATGRPRIIKKWKRGTPLSEAKQIYEGEADDVAIDPSVHWGPEGSVVFINRSISFYQGQSFILEQGDRLRKIELPEDIRLVTVFKENFILRLRSPWSVNGRTFAAGSVVSVDAKNPEHPEPRPIYEPNDRSSVISVVATRDALYVNVLHNVQGQLIEAKLRGKEWALRQVELPEKGSLELLAYDPYQDAVFVEFEGFVTPSSIFKVAPGKKPQIVKRLPSRFDSSKFEVDQWEATSKDGVLIPYFIIYRKDMKRDGSNPTLLEGYGGFEISQMPFYSGVIGKGWLEKGGVYVLANIRGGAEFGPRWHQAALRENRQKSYDDFLAIAEDLVFRKVTSKKRLGIRGGSNGGLLVGAAMTQKPELFNAVICQVPLLDMTRYHLLLAGKFWVEEYGNPDDGEMGKIIRKYSPYQNLRADVRYPKAFFLTSTKDDRVHPGHARKMVARFEEFGHPVLYFENTDGGHGASANLNERVERYSLEYVYLYRQLMGKR